MDLLQRCTSAFLFAVLFSQAISQGQIIINEIYYNPPAQGIEDGLFREFIELHNPSRESVDLSGYFFDNGISYTFPDNAHIFPGEHFVVVKDLGHSVWNNRLFRILGPYDGRLDNGGERITLRNAQGQII